MAARSIRQWYHWYSPEDSPEERKLILKLDLLIVPYVVVVYWLKYIDQTNINNAYVSGLSDDLDFHGNELVQFQTMYTVGAVVGQIPFAYLFPKLPMHWLVPGLDLGWGIFTLLQYRAQGYSEMMAYRFMVGLFESAFFPAVHYIYGSWYRADEIGRRGGFFYSGQMLGVLTAGLIQAGAAKHLDGVHGLAGWRWMFIITAVITLPFAIIGVLVWPGTPDKPNRLVLKESEIALARKRLERAGHQQQTQYSWKTVKVVLKDWKVYVLTIWDIFFWNSGTSSQSVYLLWLKSLKRFSTESLNNLSTTAPALGIFYVLFICFGADLFLTRAGAITLAHVYNSIGLIILVIWNVPESALWFAFNTSYASVSMSSVLYGWANDILKHDVDQRSTVLIIMNTVAQSTTAWINLLTYPTVEAPRFPKGYPFSLACSIALIISTWFVKYLHDRQE
ncbi:MFS transporter [Paecilomyces variotii No. 5]|uniref:MFS transporter n=1 Tax=Byssochlamys spectabilis (strain No. 5 / NBRC 109023) TaxID=1356009 RepID=V5FM68_BYSSN|nr:MFS transporter [Paecilomyces variotii No. 5]